MWTMTHVCATCRASINEVSRHDSFMWNMTHICETWLMYVPRVAPLSTRFRDMTRLCETWLIYVRHDSCMCHVSRLYQRGTRAWLGLDRFVIFRDTAHVCETWLMYVRHDSCMWNMTHVCETWLMYVRHDSFMYAMNLIYMCDSSTCDVSRASVHMWHALFRIWHASFHVRYASLHMWQASFLSLENNSSEMPKSYILFTRRIHMAHERGASYEAGTRRVSHVTGLVSFVWLDSCKCDVLRASFHVWHALLRKWHASYPVRNGSFHMWHAASCTKRLMSHVTRRFSYATPMSLFICDTHTFHMWHM